MHKADLEALYQLVLEMRDLKEAVSLVKGEMSRGWIHAIRTVGSLAASHPNTNLGRTFAELPNGTVYHRF